MTRNGILLAAGLSAAVLSFGQAGANTDTTAAKSPSAYAPITSTERFSWFAKSTAGPQSLAGGVISAAWGTLFNSPEEYGPHWEGFGKRYGMRLTGVATGNAMEVGIGAIWGEDPRYRRAAGQPFKARVGQIVKMTFAAPYSDGRNHPAYARYAAVVGNNFISNAWRADSEATAGRAGLRVGLGFLGRMASNAFLEFWPDVRQRWLTRK